MTLAENLIPLEEAEKRAARRPQKVKTPLILSAADLGNSVIGGG